MRHASSHGPAEAPRRSGQKPLKIIFIAGVGHSGSTFLAKVLGQVDGFFSCGEVRFFWNRGGCGCGAPVDECPFWAAVLERAFGTPPWAAIAEFVGLQHQVVRTRPRQLLAMERAAREGRWESSSAIRAYAGSLDSIYSSIAGETGAEVLVDSSKIPGDAYFASRLSEAEVYVLHLIRDPRTVASSWKRSEQMLPVQSSAYWLWWNGLIEVLLGGDSRRYLRVRYEDFCNRPGETIREIVDWVGEKAAQLPDFPSQRSVVVERQHMLGGNLSVYAEGLTEIKPSAESRNVDAVTRVLSTLPAIPLMPRYSYPLWNI